MKKRIMTIALSVALVIADLPMAVYAVQEGQDLPSQTEEAVPGQTESENLPVEVQETEESESETVLFTETESETETESSADSESETESETEAETEFETESETETESSINTETETEAETESETEEEPVLLDANILKDISYSAWMTGNNIEIYTAPLYKADNTAYSYKVYDADLLDADDDTLALLAEGTVTAQNNKTKSIHYLKIALKNETVRDHLYIELTSASSGILPVYVEKSNPASNLRAAAVSTSGLKLSWAGNLTGQTGWKVQIFEKDTLNKAVKTQKVTGTNVQINGLRSGTVYMAIVSPYLEVKNPDGSVKTVYDGAQCVLNNLNTQAPVLSASNGSLTITVSWTKVEGAVSYDVYRSVKGKNKFSKIKNVAGLSYKDSNLTDKTAYDYKVQPIGSGYVGTMSKVLTRTALTKPGKATKLTAKKGECMVTLSWKKAKDAAGYAIYYYDASTKKLGDKIGTATGTSFKVKGLQGGKNYTFVVRAYKKTGDGSIVYGNNSNTASAKPTFKKPEAVKDLKAAAADHAVKLSWSSVKNATGYNIYAYNTATKKVGSKIGSTKELSFLAEDLEVGKVYAFVVYPYRSVNGYTGQGKISSVVSAKPVSLKPAGITGLKATGSDKEVILNWSASKNAQGYTIYQKNTETGEYKALGSTAKTTYTIGNLDNKVTYTFRIRAYRKWGKKESHTVYGAYSADVSATTRFNSKIAAPSSLKVENSKSGNKLTWGAVKYATGYYIYRYNYSKSKYEQVATVGQVKTWKDTSIKTTKGKFKYKVCAYRIEEGKTYTGKAIEKVAFGLSDIQTVTNKIHAIYYNAYINQGTRIFATFGADHDDKIGTIDAGERVICMYRRTQRCKIKRANGDIVYVKTSALTYTSEIYTNKDYSTEEKELFVNYKGYSSKTNYLIWISTYSQHVNIFTGKKGNWKLFRSCLCATGDIETPTPLGGFNIIKKQSKKKYSNSYYRYLSKFKEANSMHTRVRYYSGGFVDSRLGRPLSHGCVRMEDANAKYIYQNVPVGTSVIVY